MADSIILSGGVRANLLALQNTSDLIGSTQTRLATGKKVNSALDNATNFFLSNAFRSSANALQGLLDTNITNATRTLEAANAGISGITTLLESAKATLNQALAIAPSTAKVTGTVSGLTTASSFTTTAGKTITVFDGTTTSTYTTVGVTTTVAQIVNAINTTPLQTIKASVSGAGNLVLEAQGATSITIAGTITAPELAQFGLVAGVTTAGTLNSSRTAFATQYNSLRTQVDQLAADSGYNGVSLLNGGGVRVQYNEANTSFQNLVGVNDSATGLGVAVAGGNLQTDFDVNAALTQISTALTTLKNQGSTFSSNLSVIQARTNFTKSQITTLQVGADGLVVSDSNEDGANLLALQTRQQLSTTALSLATQSDRSVLRLFS